MRHRLLTTIGVSLLGILVASSASAGPFGYRQPPADKQAGQRAVARQFVKADSARQAVRNDVAKALGLRSAKLKTALFAAYTAWVGSAGMPYYAPFGAMVTHEAYQDAKKIDRNVLAIASLSLAGSHGQKLGQYKDLSIDDKAKLSAFANVGKQVIDTKLSDISQELIPLIQKPKSERSGGDTKRIKQLIEKQRYFQGVLKTADAL